MERIKDQFPPGYSDLEGRKKFAVLLANEVELAKASRNAMAPRWERNRKYYQNFPEVKEQLPYPGAADSHMNMTQVKIDALGTYVVGTITGQGTYCVAKNTAGTEESREISKVNEHVVQWFADHGNLDYTLRQASVVAGLTNMGVIRVHFCPEDKDLKFQVIEPQHLIGYPTYCRSWKDLKIIGDEFSRRRAQIMEMIQEGAYLAYPSPAQPSEDTDRAMNREMVDPNITGARAGESVYDPKVDGQVTLYDLLVKAPDERGIEVWWGVTLDQNAKHILRCELYPYDYCCYNNFAYKVNLGNFYAEMSVAQDLQGLQTTVNDLLDLAQDGTRMNVFGQHFAAGGIAGQEFVSSAPGSIMQGLGLDQVSSFSPRADLTYLLPLIELMLRTADQTARISAAGVGGQLRSRTTATEAEFVASGQQSGVNEYIATFGMGMESLYACMQDILSKHKGEWFKKWGAQVGVTEEQALNLGVRQSWSLHGKSVAANPISQMQLAEMLMQLAGNPATGLDTYALAGRVLEYAERRGFANADGLQVPRDPNALVPFLAQTLQIDPGLLAEALQNVAMRQQQLAEMIDQVPDDTTPETEAAPVEPVGNPGVAG